MPWGGDGPKAGKPVLRKRSIVESDDIFFRDPYRGLPVIYKPDWSEARERLKAWWDREVLDRPAIMVTAPRSGVKRPPWDGWGFARNADDPHKVVRDFEAMCSATFFGGEAFPNLWINLGAGVVSAFLGARAVFYSDTVWFDGPRDWEELEDLELDRENPWWLRAKRDTEVAVEKGVGRYFVGMTDLGGILDIAQSLRGKKRLMVDIFRRGERVLSLCRGILEIWHACYEELDSIIERRMKGSSAWMGIWSEDRWYPLQCDYAYMLSPRLFREFVLPFVAEQCRRLDHSVYHLDGYGQLPHLDMLLSIPELDAIQWVPGAGKPQCGSPLYYDLYRRIRAAGKGLVLGVGPQEIEAICRQVGAAGVLFQTSCRKQGEAEDLLRNSKSWVDGAS